MVSKESCKHPHWTFKKKKHGGVTRKCTRCKLTITDVAVSKGSSLDGEAKILWPKGKHRPKN
jgi:hypothetical protein